MSIVATISLSTLPPGDVRIKLLPWQAAGLSFSASGYGKRIPTARMARWEGRWRRVYCCCFSNSGTCYIEAGADKDWVVITD